MVDQCVISSHRGSKRPRAKAREDRIVADTIISSYSPERSTKVHAILQPFARILMVSVSGPTTGRTKLDPLLNGLYGLRLQVTNPYTLSICLERSFVNWFLKLFARYLNG